jgi:glucose/arabinose dehydrogenase
VKTGFARGDYTVVGFFRGSKRSQRKSTKAPAWRPSLEVLEDRTLLNGANFVPGDLYVSGRTGPSISQVSSTGIATPFVTGIDTTGLAFGPDGNLYAAHFINFGMSDIYEVTPAGAVSTFATGLFGPAGLAFDTSGNLYVAEHYGNDVSKITPGGVVSTFATGMVNPDGLAFDASGNLYVASETGGYVDKITPAGVVSTFATGFSTPVGVTFDGSGNLYVANNGNGTISQVTPGGVVSTFATGFNSPEYLTYGPDGNLYVPEYFSGTVSTVGPGGGTATLFSAEFSNTEAAAFVPVTTEATATTVTSSVFD